jgi:Papain-like cysteine protease AvrRpt2
MKLGLLLTLTLLSPFVYAAEECEPPNPNTGLHRCAAGIDSSLLERSASQKMSEWCWAAAISNVLAFYGHPVSQLRIVKEAWGTVANMPGYPAQIFASLNREWTDDDGASFTVDTETSTFLHDITAYEDMEEDRPIILGALGHAVVLTRMTVLKNAADEPIRLLEVVVRDPWPGRGKRIFTPYEWGSVRVGFRINVSD